MLKGDHSLMGGVMILGLGGLVLLLRGPVSCCICNTLVKNTEGGIKRDTILWNSVYILSSAYIDVVVYLK